MTSVWPKLPFLALRGAQIFFAIIILGLAGYVGSLANSFWSPWFALVTAIFTLIGVGFFLVTFFIAPAFTAPLFTLGADAFLWLFWTISLGGWADQFGYILSYGSCGGDNACGSVKGGMAMIVFEFLLFIVTLGLSGWYFFQERRGGKTTGTSFNPEGGQVSAGAIGGAPPTPAPPPAAYNTYNQQGQQAYPMTQQQPQFTPSHQTAQPVGGEYGQQQQPVSFPNEGQYQYPTTPVPPPAGGYQQQH